MAIKVVYAKQPIRTIVDGLPMDFPGPGFGAHWPADDPYVLAHPEQFSEDPRYFMAFTETRPGYLGDEPPAETATAEPGERRNTRRTS